MLSKYRTQIILGLIILLGLTLRFFLVGKVVGGDLLAYSEWGEKLIREGVTNFYFREDWFHSYPNYLPLGQLLFGGAFWLFDHKYLLAELHNLIRIPPAAFIVYFYKYGYYLLLKLPSILADIGIGLLIFKTLKDITHDIRKSIFGFAFYFLNPITIFLSGGWGQTDSLVAFFGLLSFFFLVKKKEYLSLPFLFISLFIKPSWAIFVPLYLFILYKVRPNIKRGLLGLMISLLIFLVSVSYFTDGNVFSFTQKIIEARLSLPTGASGKATISAFNFYSLLFKIDLDFANVKFLGIPVNALGLISYLVLNIFAFSLVKKIKNILWGTLLGIFTVGLGSFLFMTNMLERYFFPALAPLIILSFAKPRMFLKMALMNLIFFANVIWAFYRRRFDEVDHPFTNYNFLLIRVLSGSLIFLVGLILRSLFRGAAPRYKD